MLVGPVDPKFLRLLNSPSVTNPNYKFKIKVTEEISLQITDLFTHTNNFHVTTFHFHFQFVGKMSHHAVL